MAKQYHGVVFESFLRKLILNKDSVKPLFNNIKAQFLDSLPKDIEIDGQVKRVANRFSLVATAGELATKWGITNWVSDDSINACITCFDDWIKHRGGYVSS